MTAWRYMSVTAAACGLLAGIPSRGWAQASTPPPPQPFTAGWQDGFALQTANGDYGLVFGLTAQTDGRFSLDTPSPIVETFTIRKARPTLSGRVGRWFDFKVMPDFGNGTTTLTDAYFELGGMQLQFNVTSSKTLREAMAHPEQFGDLLVRISGYNAYFVELNRDIQLELVERAEHCLGA